MYKNPKVGQQHRWDSDSGTLTHKLGYQVGSTICLKFLLAGYAATTGMGKPGTRRQAQRCHYERGGVGA